MVRSFTTEPVDSRILRQMLEQCLSGPSAGNSSSLQLLLLTGEDVARYWDVTLPSERRRSFPWPGLLHAPVLIVPYVEPARYLERYREPDKSARGLGESLDDWPVPYWWVDGGAAVQTLLLAASANGLGACLFGQFEHESAVRAKFDVPADFRAIGTVAVGHEDQSRSHPSASGLRPRRPFDAVVHRGRW